MSKFFKINKKKIGSNYPTYFIADIAANHDGSLAKAIKLIKAAKKAGADVQNLTFFSGYYCK